MMTRAECDAWRPDLFGWSSDILPFYERVIQDLPRNARVVEIGVYHGRSILFLAERLVALGRTDVEVWAVDPLDWDTDMLPRFLGNWLSSAPEVMRKIRLMRVPSVACARAFANASFDLAFIDADHAEIPVREDIIAWRDKIKPGGILAGHDYNAPASVKLAVDALLDNVQVDETVWSRRMP